jgi:hypothetical protein
MYFPLGEAWSLFDVFETDSCGATPSMHSETLTGIDIQSALNIGSLNTLQNLHSPSFRKLRGKHSRNHL